MSVTGNDLIRWGWEEGPAIGLALKLSGRLEGQGERPHVVKNTLDVLHQNPHAFAAAGVREYSDLANFLIRQRDVPRLSDSPKSYVTFGTEGIDENTRIQMDEAMRLPISVAGALMPDAHLGYGLPIGGVLATDENTVIPYGVGVDIACRMRLTILDIKPELLDISPSRFTRALNNGTHFGFGGWDDPFDIIEVEFNVADHPVIAEIDGHEVPFVRNLFETALSQLGTSGGGNHFVEFGEIAVGETHAARLGIDPGKYVALMSHSGSRGFGFKIANHYTEIAKKKSKLPKSHEHLAWLDLRDDDGAEYWAAMQTAGRYAEANHAVIHARVRELLGGVEQMAAVENHHNFAWKEQLPTGDWVTVHRKGATPAYAGQLGIIPGSMADVGYVVVGLGNQASLNSASHGAGRKMSRSAALKMGYSKTDLERYLAEHNVRLVGGDLDEAPWVYKPIDEVMAAQEHLVDKVAVFQPRIVRMAGD